MAIKLKIGSPVVGEDFFGREIELGKAEALIRDNNRKPSVNPVL